MQQNQPDHIVLPTIVQILHYKVNGLEASYTRLTCLDGAMRYCRNPTCKTYACRASYMQVRQHRRTIYPISATISITLHAGVHLRIG